MKLINSISRHRGFSLLEVLIAVVVLSVGLLALASLQVSLIRSSSESKAQSFAMALAKEKLELLTSYQVTGASDSSCISPSSGTVNTCYRAIDTETSELPIAIGGVTFTRTTLVSRYAYRKDTQIYGVPGNTLRDAQFVTPTTYLAGKEFKRVVVTVGWTDALGGTPTVRIEGAIPSVAPSDSLLVASNDPGNRPRPAVAIIVNPSSVPGVIPIAVGSGTDTAATNPRPVIVGTGNNSTVVETRFDIYTYSAITGGDTASAQSRVETAVVGCTCSLVGAPSSTSTAYRPTYWDGFRYVAPELVTNVVPRAAPASGTTQSALCTSCCRDHHDPSTATGALFDPRRSLAAGGSLNGSGDLPGGNHPHYLSTSGVLSNAVTAAGSNYSEACRLIRVDGTFRTAAEPYSDHYGLLATAGLNDDTQPTTTIQQAVPATGSGSVSSLYQNFVLAYLNSRFVNGSTVNTELEPSGVAGYSALQAPNFANIATGYSPKFLHARGLYVDYLESGVRTVIANAKTACQAPATPTDAQLSTCVLKFLPFTSINLTEIGDMVSSADTKVGISNYGLKTTLNDPLPVKGQATVKNGASVGDPDVSATANIQRTSAGLAVSNLVFPSSELPDRPAGCTSPCQVSNVETDTQLFRIGAGQTGGSGDKFTIALTGTTNTNKTKFLNTLTLGNPAEVRFTLGSETICDKNGVTITPYGCVPIAGQTLNGTIGVTLPIKIGNYNRQFSTTDGKLVDNACTPANNDKTRMPYVVKFDIVNVELDSVSKVVNGVAVSPATINVTANNLVGTIAGGGEYTVVQAGAVKSTTTPTLFNSNFSVEFGPPVYFCPDNYLKWVTANGADSGKPVSGAVCRSDSTPDWSASFTTVCPTGLEP